MNINSSQRDSSQDICKGICAILVILLHVFVGNGGNGIVIKFLRYTFGYIMPVFFVISGLNYTPGKRTPWQNIKRRFATLFKSYIIYGIGVSIVLVLLDLLVNGQSIQESLLGGRNTMLYLLLSGPGMKLLGINATVYAGGNIGTVIPYWFAMQLLLGGTLFFLIVDWTTKSLPRALSIIFLLCAVTFALNPIAEVGNVLNESGRTVATQLTIASKQSQFPHNIQNTPMVTALMLLGSLLKRYGLTEPQEGKKHYYIANVCIAELICVAFAWLLPVKGGIFAGNSLSAYGAWETYMALAIGFFGTIGMLGIGRLINKCRFLAAPLTWLGLRSLPILLTHTMFSGILGTLIKHFWPSASSVYLPHIYTGLTIVFLTIYLAIWGKIKPMIFGRNKEK